MSASASALALEADSPGPADPINLTTLIEWRARTAAAMAVPAYAILSDETLQAIAQARPRDRRALAKVSGLGPRALAKFGDNLLHLIHTARPPAGPREPH